MKKDILFLCQFFYPEHNSSATLPFDTAKYLAAHGFNVDALCGYPKEYSDGHEVPLKEEVDGVGIHRIRYIQLPRNKRIGRLVNYFSFTLSALLRVLKLSKYKSVIVYSNPPVLPFVAVLGNMLFGTKIVFVAYDVYPEIAYASKSLKPGSLIDRGMRWINRMMYKRVSKVVALTDEMREFLMINRPQLDAEKVVTIANWAHEKVTEPMPEAYDRFGYAPGQFIVSYFGNMGICQDMETLMGAAERLRDHPSIRFFLVGHGSKKEDIRKRIEGQKLKNVQLLDFLTGQEFEKALAISSYCVVSLEKGIKGMCAPSKYYSYLQAGKPVLAIVEDGSYLQEEVKRSEIGVGVQLGESDKLAEIIARAAKNSQACEQMGKTARVLYEKRYDLKIAQEKYQKIVEVLM